MAVVEDMEDYKEMSGMEEKPSKTYTFAEYIQGCKHDLVDPSVYFAATAELLATFLFVFVCVKSVTSNPLFENPDANGGGFLVAVAAVFGWAIAICAWIFGPISGGHFNPAVTMAFCATGDITVVRGTLYVVMQILGSVLAGLLNVGLTPASQLSDNTLGGNFIDPNISVVQGFFFEFVLTFYFLFTIYASTDSKRPGNGNNAALFIGLAGFVAHLVSVPWTGTGINPARSFGPNLMADIFGGMNGFGRGYWVFWIGPILGGILGGAAYRLAFQSDFTKGILKGPRNPQYANWMEAVDAQS